MAKHASEVVNTSNILLRLVDAPRHNLPAQTTTFIGRTAELAEISRLLQNEPDCRLLTLLGPGGIGKTRLGLQAAAELMERFADGVWFVALAPLEPVKTPGAINPLVTTLADALGFAFHGSDTPERQLLAFVGAKEMLILFDNFEHMVETAGFLSALISHAPGVKLLVTTRERLKLREEWILEVGGLHYPQAADLADEQSQTSFEAYEAIGLFLRQARRAQVGFTPSPEESAAIVRICELVGGMPLGLELAADWIRAMPCATIAREIEQNRDFLATTLRNVPARHRSMRAVFNRSWDLLLPAEQAVLRKLAILRGGFEREAAEVVAGASLLILSTLVDKSLLGGTAQGRYRMHELLRQFAEEKMQQQPGEYEALRGEHCRYYCDFLAQQEALMKGPEAKAAIAAITADIDNVRAAWRWAVRRDLQVVTKSAVLSLYIFYWLKSWYLEGNEVFDQLAASLRAQRKLSVTAGAEASAAETGPLLAVVLAMQSVFQWRLGHFEQTKASCRESLSLVPQAGEKAQWERALCLLVYGNALRSYDTQTASISVLAESLSLFRQVADPYWYAWSLAVLTETLLFLGLFAEAERTAQALLAIQKKLGEQLLIGYTFGQLGLIALARGQYRQAETYFQESLKQRAETGDRTGLAFSLQLLGRAAWSQGDYARAEAYYQQSIALAKEISLPTAKVFSLEGLARLAESRGDYGSAKALAHKALMTTKEIGLLPSSLAYIGWAALGLAERQEAEEHFQAALQTATERQRLPSALDALAGLAHCLAQAGKPAQALELLSLVLHHPITTQETKNRLPPLQAELVAELPSDQVTPAQRRGRERRLEAVLKEWVGEVDLDLDSVIAQIKAIIQGITASEVTDKKPLVASPNQRLAEPLSERELEVLRLIAAGRSNRQIAADLVLALGTVKKHVSNILGKLQAANRTEAVRRAQDLEIL